MTRADAVIDGWKQMYVSGSWTLGQFEAHLDAMLPVIPPEWYGEPAIAPRRGGRTAKDAAERWSAGVASAASTWQRGVTAYKGAPT